MVGGRDVGLAHVYIVQQAVIMGLTHTFCYVKSVCYVMLHGCLICLVADGVFWNLNLGN